MTNRCLMGCHLDFSLKIHIDVALQAAIVELAFFCGLGAEIVFKFRLGGDDIFFPTVSVFEVATQSPVELLR